MGLTRKMNRHLDSNSGLPPELTNSINDLFDEVYGGSEQEEDEEKTDPGQGDEEDGRSV